MQVCPIDIAHRREDASWVIRRFRDATRDIDFLSVPVCSVFGVESRKPTVICDGIGYWYN